jgi:hypothetical protein
VKPPPGSAPNASDYELQQAIVAQCDIKEGDEILVNYREYFYNSRKDRRQNLKNSFNFLCCCELCTDDVLEGVNQKIVSVTSNIIQLCNDDPENAGDLIEECIHLCKNQMKGQAGRLKQLHQNAHDCYENARIKYMTISYTNYTTTSANSSSINRLNIVTQKVQYHKRECERYSILYEGCNALKK